MGLWVRGFVDSWVNRLRSGTRSQQPTNPQTCKPTNLLSYKLPLLFLAAVAADSCAKFPPGGGVAGATRLSFQFTTAASIDPNSIYVVAIRVLTPPEGSDPGLSDPTEGPSPVVTTGSQNGIVAGLPTHYVVFVPTDPNLYQVFRFPLQSEAPNPSDPTTPINLIWPGRYVGEVIQGSGIDPTPTTPGGPYGQTLGFTIDTSYLSQLTNGQPIQIIQFNILTMNVRATTSNNVANRVMDAIGDQSSVAGNTFNNPIQINLTTSGTYSDQTSSVPERQNDTFPSANYPPIDLTSWQLTVTPP